MLFKSTPLLIISIALLIAGITWFALEQAEDAALTEDDNIACTMDAKQCPDGSYVGRVGPDCEFAACPTPPEPASATSSDDVATGQITCTPESREAEACIEIYQPVCGQVQVECVTTPCEPVEETFSNSCFACMNDRVISYSEGACTPVEANL